MKIKVNTPKLRRRLVYFPAIGTDFSIGSGERAEVPHLDDGFSEIGGEGQGVITVSRDLRVSGATAEELLIGVQEALVANQSLEKSIVERHRTGGVERREVVVVAGARTRRLQRRRERCIDVALVVGSCPERRAPGLTYGMSSYTYMVPN